ncbi:RloB family protein [Streptomyces sp. NPDC093261]|uniref:RloB family protein n=1 Tax=Streptomyces sp. NPDC093261 TaxID=3366037 RepID=UPI00382423A7
MSSRRQRQAGGAVRRSPASYRDLSQRVVYVATEGARTEQDYVKLLNDVYARDNGFFLRFCPHPDRNGLRPKEVVETVVEAARGTGAEMWALFDRDSGDKTAQEIRDAMRLAARHGVQVALSHPSFELWLLLHFQQHTSPENGRNAVVIDKLRRHPDADGYADYDTQSGDRGKSLGGRRGQALLRREGTAIRNARALVRQCPHPHGGCSARGLTVVPIPEPNEPYDAWTRRTGHALGCDPAERDPSSDVWRLLVSLGIGADESR